MKFMVFFLFISGLLLIDKVLSVNQPKDGKIRPTFDEIYGKEWDEDAHQQIKAETSPLNSGENALNEHAVHDDNIDQDVEAYNSDSTDQNLTQEDPDRIDQSDDETIKGINEENEFNEKEKREIISKFNALKEEYKKKGKYLTAKRVKIEHKIGKDLGANRKKIYKWKKEFGLSRKMKEKREFMERIDEIKMSQRGEQNKLAKDLGISRVTFRCWKKKFGLPVNSYSDKTKFKLMKKYSKIKRRNSKISDIDIVKMLNISANTLYKWKNEYGFCANSFSKSEKLELMEKYYKIKQKNPKISGRDIANKLNIGYSSLQRWKKQFVNSVDEHLLPENQSTFANDTSERPMPSSDDNLWAWNLTKKKRTERIEVGTP